MQETQNPPGWMIRDALPHELTHLPAIEAQADALLDEIPGFATSALPAVAPPMEYAGSLAVLLCELDSSELAGFARLETADGGAHLEQLSVRPRRARQGIGTALLEAAVIRARELGYRSMTLCTFADVPFNGPFYERHGFAATTDLGSDLVGLRHHEKDLGLDAMGTRVVMRRKL